MKGGWDREEDRETTAGVFVHFHTIFLGGGRGVGALELAHTRGEVEHDFFAPATDGHHAHLAVDALDPLADAAADVRGACGESRSGQIFRVSLLH
jgi:hypothetical protein